MGQGEKIMRIVLSTLNARFSHSSLALRYLRSRLRLQFHDRGKESPEIILAEYSINELVDFILGDLYRMKPDLAGFSCYIWNIEQTFKLCSKLKKVSPHTFIVLGGPEVSYDSFRMLNEHDYIDAVVMGEGENSFGELASELSNGSRKPELSGIEGLSYREDGQVKVNQTRPLERVLDRIASPYQGAGARKEDAEEIRHRTVYFESSRGCPNQCQYCMSSTQPGVRYYSIPRVKDDLNALVEMGATQIKFVDRTFNCHPDRAHQIWEYLINKHYQHDNWRKVRFHFEIGADRLNEDSLNILKQAPPGLFEFEIGVQSTNPSTLEAIKRCMDWEKLKENVAALREMDNVRLHLDLIAGLPHEPYQTFRKSFNDVYALKPHRLQLGFLKLLKGSGMREEAYRYGYRFSDYPPYEVLSNDDLGFFEILRLRSVEDLLEKYYNSGRFAHSLAFLEYWCRDSMGFYEDMADFWEEEGFNRSAQSSRELYKILKLFGERWLAGREISGLDGDLLRTAFVELLKLDYLLQTGHRSLPEWFPRASLKDQKQRVHDTLRDESVRERFFPEFGDMSAREINKRIHVEVFDCDVIIIAENLTGKSLGKVGTLNVRPDKTAVGFKPGTPQNTFFRLPLL